MEQHTPPASMAMTTTTGSAVAVLDDDHHTNWQVVLKSDNDKVVLYNSKQNSLSVHAGRDDDAVEYELEYSDEEGGDDDDELEVISQTDDASNVNNSIGSKSKKMKKSALCPLCLHPLSNVAVNSSSSSSTFATSAALSSRRHQQQHQQQHIPPTSSTSKRRQRLPSYFSLLSEANSRNSTPRTTATAPMQEGGAGLNQATLNSGYFETFFRPVEKLGKGGNGLVHLVRHVLNGEALGLYACKRITVGDSSPNLLRILREVHLLESLQHPNIITYHHAWVEQGHSTPFSPAVPTLFILMQYANGGSLESFISQRCGISSESPSASLSNAERVRRMRFSRTSAVHLLRIDEIVAIFKDITEGLGFLHRKNILHLDLKSENVLLHWEEEDLLPRAKLSDFGSSDFSNEVGRKERTGATGTIDWTPPESWDVDAKTGKAHCPDRATDQWALGLILHFLCFFTLPYRPGIDLATLEVDIRAYPGFFVSDASSLDHGTRHDLPQSLLKIMARLIHRTPSKRPSCEEVLVLLQKVLDESTNILSASVLQGAIVSRRSSNSPGRFQSATYALQDVQHDCKDILHPLAVVGQHTPIPTIAQRHRFERRRRQAFVLLFGLLRNLSLQYLCRPERSISSFSIYIVLLPTLLDALCDSERVSLLLLATHAVLLVTMEVGWIAGLGLCA